MDNLLTDNKIQLSCKNHLNLTGSPLKWRPQSLPRRSPMRTLLWSSMRSPLRLSLSPLQLSIPIMDNCGSLGLFWSQSNAFEGRDSFLSCIWDLFQIRFTNRSNYLWFCQLCNVHPSFWDHARLSYIHSNFSRHQALSARDSLSEKFGQSDKLYSM